MNGGALLDGKLEEYERAWQAAGGTDISVESLGGLFDKLGQPLGAGRLADIQKSLQLAKPGKISFPQFLEMFRADLLDLREILDFLQMGSKSPDGLLAKPEVQPLLITQQLVCRDAIFLEVFYFISMQHDTVSGSMKLLVGAAGQNRGDYLCEERGRV